MVVFLVFALIACFFSDSILSFLWERRIKNYGDKFFKEPVKIETSKPYFPLILFLGKDYRIVKSKNEIGEVRYHLMMGNKSFFKTTDCEFDSIWPRLICYKGKKVYLGDYKPLLDFLSSDVSLDLDQLFYAGDICLNINQSIEKFECIFHVCRRFKKEKRRGLCERAESAFLDLLCYGNCGEIRKIAFLKPKNPDELTCYYLAYLRWKDLCRGE